MPTKIEKDEISGTPTTGHEWDGIRELDTPLPRWWVWTFYATIVFAVGYWIVYPAWPTLTGYTHGVLGWSQYHVLADRMREAQEAKGVYLEKVKAMTVDQILADKQILDFAVAGGKAAFADNCTPCHGAGGAGAKGYPNLADDDWLFGGGIDQIYNTVQFGARNGNAKAHATEMPRFGADGILTPEQISDVADFVLSLSGTEGNKDAIKRGKQIFAENCAACHGENAEGSTDLGAPRLSDGIWLYGGDKATVMETITNARHGVMPAWSERLPDTTVKMLAVYVHSLGGSQ
jgi:cytochrome c oxidase cbb3-type subunit 3